MLNCELLEHEVTGVLGGFEAAWSFDVEDLHKPTSEQVVRQLIAKCEGPHHERLAQEFFEQGPFTDLMLADGVQEIVVNGAREVWFESLGEFQKHPDRFLSDLTFKNFIDRLCAEAGIKVDLAQPFADGRWRGFRVHLACAPLTHCTYHLTLRKMAENPWTLDRLNEAGWCDEGQAKVIRQLISERKNVLVLGPTGCGKTTVLGACMREFGERERVVIIEDTDELWLPNTASTKMLTRPAVGAHLPEVTLTDLVRQSLRMRPFRLVIGEVRGAEAKDLLLALATGHSGSWGTLHASEARQALLRLEMLIQLGAPQWGVEAIRQLLQLSVDALIVCGNKNGHRHLEGVYRVAALESFGFLLEPMT